MYYLRKIYLSTKNNAINFTVWTGKKYETLTNKSYNELKKSNLIEVFKKIKVDKNSVFFKNEQAIIWYGKNLQGVIEYFNSEGKHPETNTPLKEITPSFLKKHGLLVD